MLRCLLIIMLSCFCYALFGEERGEKNMPHTYYLDAVKGNDNNNGQTAAQAWQSLSQLSQEKLSAGTTVKFSSGQTFKGNLTLQAKGTAEKRIILESSGKQPATIEAGEGTGIDVSNSAFLTVRNLKIVGCGRKNGSNGDGLLALRTKNLHIDQVEVRGFRLSGISTGGDSDTRITNVEAHDNGFAGISVYGGWEDLPMSSNLYIGHCKAHDNPGDPKNLTNHSGNGIIVGGLKTGLIEYCEAWNNGWDMPRKGNGPVGIWGWYCDKLTIQHCISHDNKTAKGATDGGGFDLDGGATNSILQYNLSYNNHGTGYLLCQFPEAPVWKNNICRFNVSINDGQTTQFAGINFWAGGKGISDAQIYNNTVINKCHAVASTNDIPGLVFTNNIFIGQEEVISGPLLKAEFKNNLYWSTKGKAIFKNKKTTYRDLADWQQASKQIRSGMEKDPKLPLKFTDLPRNPEDLAKFAKLLKPGKKSPAYGSAIPVPENGGRDLTGNRIPEKGPKNLGAIQ